MPNITAFIMWPIKPTTTGMNENVGSVSAPRVNTAAMYLRGDQKPSPKPAPPFAEKGGGVF